MRRAPARAHRFCVPSAPFGGRAAACVAALAAAVCEAQVAAPPPPVGSPAELQTQAEIARAQSERHPLTIVPSVTIEETLTNNVNLVPNPSRRSDLVTQINPGFTVSERGPRTQLEGSVFAPILLYARTGSENNRVVPAVSLVGTVEAVERIFFLEGAVKTSQEYFTPFGARSASIVNNPQNAYVSQIYSFSPYFKGTTPGGVDFLLRDNNIWSNLSSTPISTNNSYMNEVVGSVSRAPRPVGWALEYDRSDVKFTGQSNQLTELSRVRGIYRPDAAVEVSAGVGYEHVDYPFTSSNDFVYSFGGRWRPTERTTADAFWEHRFFGSSYRVTFDHRTPLTVWNVSASRNITSYPQSLAELGAGTIVPLMLDALFASRIPDRTQRQQFVIDFIRNRGLPLVLTSPLNLYTQQIYLQENASATVGLIGARNTAFATVYRLRTQPISGSGVILPLVDLQNNNTQTGAGIVWTYNINGTTTLSTAADYLHTTANAPLTGRTNQGSVRTIWTTSISGNTSVYAGARFQSMRSDFTPETTSEVAGYAGLTHTFR